MNYRSYSSKSNNNISILKDLDLNQKNIYPLHKTLDDIKDIDYKLNGYSTYPENYYNNDTNRDDVLKKIISDKFEDGKTYSMAIQGYSKDDRSMVTYGPHVLITSKLMLKV
jgi:hypothetical protein